MGRDRVDQQHDHDAVPVACHGVGDHRFAGLPGRGRGTGPPARFFAVVAVASALDRVLYAVLLPVVFLFAPLEARGRPADSPVPAAARQIGGAVMICLGVAYLALFGFGSAPLPGLDIAAFATVIAGSAISGLLHGYARPN